MQINRLFEIIYILLDKQTVTSKELAEQFEVSTRTIYRDIDTLSSAGVPVYMSKGKGGGISLLPNFVLNKSLLTNEEKDDVLMSLKAINSLNVSKTDTALKKLKSLFGEQNADWIEIDFSSWNNSDNEKEIFSILKSAVINKRIVCFTYASTKGQQTKRNVEPLKLCFKNSSWYLYGYCTLKNDYRFFKLKRIKNLIVSKQSFKRETPTRVFIENDTYKKETIKLKLKLSSSVAFRVFEEFEHYELQKDGSFIVDILFPNNEWLIYYINTFGKNCEVLEPYEVRQEIKNGLEETLKNYT